MRDVAERAVLLLPARHGDEQPPDMFDDFKPSHGKPVLEHDVGEAAEFFLVRQRHGDLGDLHVHLPVNDRPLLDAIRPSRRDVARWNRRNRPAEEHRRFAVHEKERARSFGRIPAPEQAVHGGTAA